MKNRSARMSVLLLLASWTISANAHDIDLQQCARIASVVDRLDCYDGLAAASRPARPAAVAVPATPAAPAQAAAIVQPEADFGFEARRSAEGAQEIHSRYDGQFSGWSGKTLFKLENGQVWKQSERSRMVLHSSRPEITISRGLFGSFKLSVEGTNKSVRVKRVK